MCIYKYCLRKPTEVNRLVIVCNLFCSGEIDRCLKKVQEGVDIFEDLWQKVSDLCCRYCTVCFALGMIRGLKRGLVTLPHPMCNQEPLSGHRQGRKTLREDLLLLYVWRGGYELLGGLLGVHIFKK